MMKLFIPIVKAAPLFSDPTGNPLGEEQLSELIETLQTYVSSFAGLAAVAVIIWGAAIYIMAAGDPDKIKKGKQVLTYGVLGVVFILLANVAVRVFILLLGGSA